MKKRTKNTIALLPPVVVFLSVTLLSLMPPRKIPRVGSWFTQIPHNDKIVHFGFYFLLVSAIRFSLTYITGYRKAFAWRIFLLCALYGGVIELVQGQFFHRGCDVWDEAANILGAVVALWIIPQNWHVRIADKTGRELPSS